MEDQKYSVGYFAGGIFAAGIVLVTSGMMLMIAAALMAVVCKVQAVGVVRYWPVLLLAGFVAAVPGVFFLFISRRLKNI